MTSAGRRARRRRRAAHGLRSRLPLFGTSASSSSPRAARLLNQRVHCAPCRGRTRPAMPAATALSTANANPWSIQAIRRRHAEPPPRSGQQQQAWVCPDVIVTQHGEQGPHLPHREIEQLVQWRAATSAASRSGAASEEETRSCSRGCNAVRNGRRLQGRQLHPGGQHVADGVGEAAPLTDRAGGQTALQQGVERLRPGDELAHLARAAAEPRAWRAGPGRRRGARRGADPGWPCPRALAPRRRPACRRPWLQSRRRPASRGCEAATLRRRARTGRRPGPPRRPRTEVREPAPTPPVGDGRRVSARSSERPATSKRCGAARSSRAGSAATPRPGGRRVSRR